MNNITVPADWRLAAAVQAFLALQNWNDELDIDVEARKAVLRCDYTIKSQPFRLIVATNEVNEWVQVILFTPYQVPAARFPDACMVITELNARTTIGRFGLDLSESASPVTFKVAYDMEGGDFSGPLVTTMLRAAAGAVHQWFDVLPELAFSKRTGTEIVEGLRAG